MELAYDNETGALLGQVVNINTLGGVIRVLCKGGGYRSILAEYVHIEVLR